MGRFLTVILAVAAVAALIGVVVPAAPAEGANPPIPTIRSLLPCAPLRDVEEDRRIDAAGSGFPRGSTVRVVFTTRSLIGDAGMDIASIVSPAALGIHAAIVAPPPSVDVVVDDLGTFTAVLPSARFYPGNLHVLTAGVISGPEARAETLIQACPVLSATANCNGGPASSVSVSLLGLAEDNDAFLTIREARGGPVLGSVTVTGNGNARAQAEMSLNGIAPGSYIIEATGRYPSAWVRVDPFDSRCPNTSVSVTPRCERGGAPPDRMDLRITGTGHVPEGTVEIVLDPARSYEVWEVFTGDGSFAVTISPYRRDNAQYVVRIRSQRRNVEVRQDRLTVTIPCEQPKPEPVTPQPEPVTPRPEQVTPKPEPVVTPTPAPTPRPKARISVGPKCVRPAIQGDGRRQIELPVRGHSFDPGPVTLRFEPRGQAARTFRTTADAQGRIDATIRPAAPPTGLHRIIAIQRLANGKQITARAQVTSPCRDREPPPLVIEPTCGIPAEGVADAYSIAIVGEDFYRGSDVSIRYGGAENTERFSADPDAKGRVRTTIVVDGRREELVPIVAEQLDTRGRPVARSSARLLVPCPIDPSITLEPGHGPPGYTTRVAGDDFHPGSTVTLTWDDGLEGGRPFEVTVEADGTFEMHLLILPNDWSGERTLQAGLPGEPDAFPGVHDEYLVVPGSGRSSGPDGEVIDRH